MQASTTLRRPTVSKRMVAYVVALAAALALGGAAGFAAKSTIGAPQAPASVRDTLPMYPIVDEEPLSVNAGSAPAQADQGPGLTDIPGIGFV